MTDLDPDERTRWEHAADLFGEGRRDEAVALYADLARGGNQDCRMFLGSLYLAKDKGLSDPDQALFWLEPLALGGDPKAQYLYSLGLEQKDEIDASMDWLRRSADQDYGPASLRLGMCYSSGTHLPKDSQEAFRYFESAHRYGHVFGTRFYGQCLMQGVGGWLLRPLGVFLYLYSFPKALLLAIRRPDSDHFML